MKTDPPFPTSPPSSIAGETIGIFGLGLMGLAMAGRLLQRGIPLIGFDPEEKARQNFAALGGQAVNDPNLVLSRISLAILCLPSHREVASLLEIGQAEIRPGLLVLDTSTGDPDSAMLLARDLAQKGMDYADATVSGHSGQVASGEAVFFLGAQPPVQDRARKVLDLLCQKWIATGPPGSASRAKLLSNMVLGLNRAALAEGLNFALGIGFSPHEALDILTNSMAYSRIMDTKGGKMARGDYQPQARLRQHAKDVSLMLDQARKSGTWTPLTQTHESMLQRGIDLGMGDWDNAALFEVLKKGNQAPLGDSETNPPSGSR